MSNEQQKPATPATNPAQAPQQKPQPQQDQSGHKPDTDKPGVQQQQK
jgi:hypothetical protein